MTATHSPSASTATPTMRSLLAELDAIVTRRPEATRPAAVALALQRHIRRRRLLTPAQRRSSADHYRTNVVHVHPAGLYSVVALVWRPGQRTPIHSHRSWCAVAVHEGREVERTFRRRRRRPRRGRVADPRAGRRHVVARRRRRHPRRRQRGVHDQHLGARLRPRLPPDGLEHPRRVPRARVDRAARRRLNGPIWAASLPFGGLGGISATCCHGGRPDPGSGRFAQPSSENARLAPTGGAVPSARWPTSRTTSGALARDGGFSGAVRVDRAGTTELAVAFGDADRAHGIANTVDTRFGVASGTKGLTALTIVSLIEDGILSFDTRAREVLGSDLPLIDDRVTIEHLLGHTSGIGDYLDEETWRRDRGLRDAGGRAVPGEQ